jgi:hypothetical protein
VSLYSVVYAIRQFTASIHCIYARSLHINTEVRFTNSPSDDRLMVHYSHDHAKRLRRECNMSPGAGSNHAAVYRGPYYQMILMHGTF